MTLTDDVILNVFHLQRGPFLAPGIDLYLADFCSECFQITSELETLHAVQKMSLRQAVTYCGKAMTSEEYDVAVYGVLAYSSSAESGISRPWSKTSSMAQCGNLSKLITVFTWKIKWNWCVDFIEVYQGFIVLYGFEDTIHGFWLRQVRSSNLRSHI